MPRSNADAMQHASLSSAGMTARTILIVQARRKFSQLDSRIRLPGVTLKPSARTAGLMDVSSQYRCPCGQAQGRAQPVRGKRPAPCPPVGKVSATPRHKTQAAVRNAGRVSTSLSRVPAVASMGFQNCNCPLPPPRSVRAFQSGMVGFRLASQNRDRIYVQGRQHKTRLSARGIS